jgi:type I restriction enzyme S subunit
MARDWPHLPKFQSEEDASDAAPEGWSTHQIEDIFDKLEIGKRFDQKTSFTSGRVPVIDQSADGFVGYHDEEPGVAASKASPVITFANHTCEMRIMRRPFSVIQNVFPMVGRLGVCDTLFFYYATKGRVHLEEYKGHYPDFRRLWINLPPLAEQKAIAAVLGALDDKIELNRRMNATLEAMARALFQSWFVDFDPVRAKLDGRQPPNLAPATAALFPASFQDSDLGHIPKGWRVGSLGEVIDVFDSKRVPLSGREREQRKGAYPYHGAASVMDYVDDYLFDGIYMLMGEDGSVINDDGTPVTQYVWGKFWVNNHAHVLRGKNGICSEHLLLHLKGSNIAAFVTGAVQPKLNQGNMNRIPFIIPAPEIGEAFGDQIAPLFARIRANTDQSRTLATLRDTLLPKLLSGELSVEDVSRNL